MYLEGILTCLPVLVYTGVLLEVGFTTGFATSFTTGFATSFTTGFSTPTGLLTGTVSCLHALLSPPSRLGIGGAGVETVLITGFGVEITGILVGIRGGTNGS